MVSLRALFFFFFFFYNLSMMVIIKCDQQMPCVINSNREDYSYIFSLPKNRPVIFAQCNLTCHVNRPKDVK